MPSPFEFALIVFAIHRTWVLLAYDALPFDIGEKIRDQIARKWAFQKDAPHNVKINNQLGNLVDCVWCTSLWLALGVVVVQGYEWWLVLALSGAVGLIEQVTEGSSDD